MKRMIAWALAVCAMLGLCACGGTEIELDTPAPEATEAPVVEYAPTPAAPAPEDKEISLRNDFYGADLSAWAPGTGLWVDEDLSAGADSRVRFAVQTETGVCYVTAALGVISAYQMDRALAADGGTTPSGCPYSPAEDAAGFTVYRAPYLDGAVAAELTVEPGKDATEEQAAQIYDALFESVTLELTSSGGSRTSDALRDPCNVMTIPSEVVIGDELVTLTQVIDAYGLVLTGSFKNADGGQYQFRTRGALTEEEYEAADEAAGWYSCEVAGFEGRARVYADMSDLVCEAVFPVAGAYPVFAVTSLTQLTPEELEEKISGEKSAETWTQMLSYLSGVMSEAVVDGAGETDGAGE